MLSADRPNVAEMLWTTQAIFFTIINITKTFDPITQCDKSLSLTTCDL